MNRPDAAAPLSPPAGVSGGGASGFRADVQGLRAVAVLVVIAGHAGIAGFDGGFVGVDVFFVISGFLITGLLVREVQRTGSVSLLDFYARRARRILPAATVVLVATVAISAVVVPVLRTSAIFTDAVWAAFFAANLRFAAVETDYFATDQPVSPLQHYWSLAVEEQFYLVWPVLLLVVALVVRRRAATSARTPALLVLGAVTAASLAWSVWATYASPATAYFSTLTRFWELGLGAVLALVLAAPGGSRAPGAATRPRPGRGVLQAGALLGVAGVAWSVVTFDETTAMPGVAALVPVLAAVLLLGVGALPGGETTLVARVLSTPPARVLGDWSFSLYLWHFPVLRIAGTYWGERTLSTGHLLVALGATVVLSALTFHLVEQPFRRGRRLRAPRVAVALYPLSVGVLVLAVAAGHGWVDRRLSVNDGNPAITAAQFDGDGAAALSQDPTEALVQASVLAAREGQGVPGDLVPALDGIREDTASLGDCDYRTGTRALCPRGDLDAERTMVVIGDSHARAWSPATDLIAERHGYTSYNLVFTGCSANQAQRLDPETGREWEACDDFKEWSLDVVADLQPDLVLVSSAALPRLVGPQGPVGLGRARAFRALVLDGMRRELELLRQDAARVVLLANTPKLPREPAVCLSQLPADLGACLLEAGPEARAYQLGFARVAREVGAEAIDAEKWFCYEQACPAVVGRYVTMRDSEHMTTAYARELAEPLAVELGLEGPDGPG